MQYQPALPALIDQYPPALSAEAIALSEQVAMELRAADEAGSTGPSTVPLLRSESAASSKIEQIDVKQRYVARAIAGYPTKQRAAREVAANIAAVQEALEDPDQDLDTERMNRIHRTLLPEENWSGALREVQNWIGGSDHSPRDARYVPPIPDDVPGLVADLARFANRRDLPAVAQAGILHAQFEAVHPYVDGNGRVGRALVHRVLRRRGVVRHGIAPVSVALLAQGDSYLEALRSFDAGDTETFVRQFADSGLLAAKASRQLAADLKDLVSEWHELDSVAGSRSDATVRRLIMDLPEHPVIDTNWVIDRYQVSRRTALNALDALLNDDVLNRTTAARGLYVYEAIEVLALIEGVETDLRAGLLTESA